MSNLSILNQLKGQQVKVFANKIATKKCPITGFNLTFSEKIFTGYGIFIDFGLDVFETENSCASYTCALVMRKNGAIKSVPIDCINFTNADKFFN